MHKPHGLILPSQPTEWLTHNLPLFYNINKHAYHGANSAALLPGSMWNKFQCFFCSGVDRKLIWNWLSGDEVIPTKLPPPWPFCCLFPQNCPSISSPSPQTVDVSWLLHRMGGAALTNFLTATGCPSWFNYHHNHHPIFIIMMSLLLSLPLPSTTLLLSPSPLLLLIVVVDIVIIAILAVGVADITVAIIAVANMTSSLHHCCTWCSPWGPIWGILPNQAKVISPMAWGWSAWPWIGRRVAASFARMISCPWCRPVGDIMAFGWWRMQGRYPTVLQFITTLNEEQGYWNTLKHAEQQKHSSITMHSYEMTPMQFWYWVNW